MWTMNKKMAPPDRGGLAVVLGGARRNPESRAKLSAAAQAAFLFNPTTPATPTGQFHHQHVNYINRRDGSARY